MRGLRGFAWGICVVGCMGASALEKIVQLDQWDFNGTFDIETKQGLKSTLDYVLTTDADTVLVRTMGGSTQLYHSPAEERTILNDAPLDERRIADERQLPGWMRLHGGVGVDGVRTLLDDLKGRNRAGGLYWPFEENHWFTSKVGIWNLEHPQFWCVNASGKPFMGRCSLAFTEVLEHKLRLLDEMLALGGDTLYIETFRTGGWTVKDEYVKPNLDAWARRYPGEARPKPDDPRWIGLVGESQYRFFKAVRARLDGCGRKMRFLFGAYGLSPRTNPCWTMKACDWERYVREGIVDGIVIESLVVDWSRPMESVKETYLDVKRRIGGTCPFYCPVTEYNFQKCGIPEFAMKLGRSKQEVTFDFLKLADEVGAAGVLLECVDYGNYTPEMIEVIRNYGK